MVVPSLLSVFRTFSCSHTETLSLFSISSIPAPAHGTQSLIPGTHLRGLAQHLSPCDRAVSLARRPHRPPVEQPVPLTLLVHPLVALVGESQQGQAVSQNHNSRPLTAVALKPVTALWTELDPYLQPVWEVSLSDTDIWLLCVSSLFSEVWNVVPHPQPQPPPPTERPGMLSPPCP